ncbi:MAG: hypothetical protein ACQCN3_03140 [Candidatus Bathyarchaeia archaeon]|jgi:hypothetical protein
MMLPDNLGRKLRFAFHSFGLSCLGGAIFLQILVFTDIFSQGYFMAIEQNTIVLSGELALTAFAATYFLYIYQRLMRQIK